MQRFPQISQRKHQHLRENLFLRTKSCFPPPPGQLSSGGAFTECSWEMNAARSRARGPLSLVAQLLSRHLQGSWLPILPQKSPSLPEAVLPPVTTSQLDDQGGKLSPRNQGSHCCRPWHPTETGPLPRWNLETQLEPQFSLLSLPALSKVPSVPYHHQEEKGRRLRWLGSAEQHRGAQGEENTRHEYLMPPFHLPLIS